ncbi:phosphohydrolase [candidate division KSB1 bacterium]|nr:MAG: phosphohydrolase [candidate division KSB1 bacterium]
MEREEALELVKKHVSNKNLIKHMIAVEAVMKFLARRFGEDEELWGLAGLLHDLDYDRTADDFENHGKITAEILEKTDVPEQVIYAIKSHPGHFPRKSLMDKALFAADPITGLIVAATLMHPTKKIKNVDVEFVKRRFKEKRFAAGANRDQIKSCSEAGIELDDFIALSLEAMQSVDKELGL